MTEKLFMSVAMTIIQLGGAYLRYLPFSSELSAEKIAELKKKILIWGIVSLILNLFLFSEAANYRAWKISLSINWIPYFLLSLTVITKKIPQHVFVLGTQLLWSFMLHSFSGMTVALFFGTMSEEHLPLQTTFYIVYFVAFLRIELKFFVNILPTPKFFEDNSLKWSISILPLAIFIGTTIQIIDVTFLPTWKERFSRIFFPIFFLLIYRSMSITTRRVTEIQRQERRERLLRRQMDSIIEHNSLVQKNHREVVELRQNLAENYRRIDLLLAERRISEAMQFIRRQGNLLDSTRVENFCAAPLINAAISIYFSRAEEIGIKINHKIDLSANFSTDESDLAVLLSNLLENAINASKKQKKDARELNLIVRNDGTQYVLEISNRYDFPIPLGENNLPYTSEIGHGLGMTSLELFAKKYDAFVDFAHEENLACLSIYWCDEFNDARNTA